MKSERWLWTRLEFQWLRASSVAVLDLIKCLALRYYRQCKKPQFKQTIFLDLLIATKRLKKKSCGQTSCADKNIKMGKIYETCSTGQRGIFSPRFGVVLKYDYPFLQHCFSPRNHSAKYLLYTQGFLYNFSLHLN